ncbi:zinc transporter 6-A [Hyalella azteca]|uniref:Zinc transporter 6-A n=1 Tax=Hyalella azteca TaxID=294128 RepID=A0A8B7NEU0_HYAAZ|nr:zinc transporter 6-A [Hyalella azteca]
MTSFWNDLVQLLLKNWFHSILLLVSFFLSAYQSFISEHSTCLALLSFNNLCLFNLLRIVSHLIGLWSDSFTPSSNYSYGLIRVRVMVVFSSLVLMALVTCCTLRVILVFLLIKSGDVLRSCSSAGNALLLGLEVLVLTAVISGTMPVSPIDCVIRAASTAASHPFLTSFSIMSKKHLPKAWRPRSILGSHAYKFLKDQLCPVLLLVFTSWLMLVSHSVTLSFIASLFGEISTSTFVLLLDSVTAMCILGLAASYLWQPFLLTTRVLMQAVSVPSNSVLQRALHRASTIDGVLELRHTNAWSLTPHCFRPHGGSSHTEALVCSVLVRLQRDADPATVVRQLKECLQHCVAHLTIQVYKDDWEQSAGAAVRVPQRPSLIQNLYKTEASKFNSNVPKILPNKHTAAMLSVSPAINLILEDIPRNTSNVSQNQSIIEAQQKVTSSFYSEKIPTMSQQSIVPPLPHNVSPNFISNMDKTKTYLAEGDVSNCIPIPDSSSNSHLNAASISHIPSSVSSGLGMKRTFPSHHYVNVNLPTYEVGTRLSYSRRTGLQDGLSLPPHTDVKDRHLSDEKADHIQKYQQIITRCESKNSENMNSIDQESSHYVDSRNENSNVLKSFHNAVFHPSPSSVLMNQNLVQRDGIKSETLTKWPYSTHYDLDEHAYVNIDFIGKS